VPRSESKRFSFRLVGDEAELERMARIKERMARMNLKLSSISFPLSSPSSLTQSSPPHKLLHGYYGD
jgi:hypothetical protein